MFHNSLPVELIHQSVHLITGLACHPVMPWFAIGLVDPVDRFGRVEIWDLEAMKILKRKDFGQAASPTHLGFTQDGVYLVFGIGAGVMVAWRTEDDHPVIMRTGSFDQISLGQNHLVAVSGKDSIQLWNLDTAKNQWTNPVSQVSTPIPVSELKCNWPADYLDTGGGMMAPISIKACLTPDGDKLFVSGDISELITVLETNRMERIAEMQPGPLLVKYSKASNRFLLVVGEAPMGEFLWRISDGERVFQQYFKNFVPGFNCYAFHPHEPMLATGGKAGMVIIYHLEREKGIAVQEVGGLTSEHFLMDFAAGGTRLIVVSRDNAIFQVDVSQVMATL